MTQTTTQAVGRIIVPGTKDMDDDIFIRHMNLRHNNSLGNLTSLQLRYISPYVMECYRIFHKQLHLFHIDLDHEHLEG